MIFLLQSWMKIYVSFHTQGPCFWLNCAKSPDFDRALAASLTLTMTSWALALSCPTATVHKPTPRKATAIRAKILLLFIRNLLSDQKRHPVYTRLARSQPCRNDFSSGVRGYYRGARVY